MNKDTVEFMERVEGLTKREQEEVLNFMEYLLWKQYIRPSMKAYALLFESPYRGYR